MKIIKKNKIKVAIDSPAAAGAGTLAKKISKHYNLYYLDTGKIYRLIAYLKIKFPQKFNKKFIKKKIKKLKKNDLNKKELISDIVGTEASVISKNKEIRKIVHSFQINCAYNPPRGFDGSCLDGRDITYNIIPDADFKFFITANIKTRAIRRYKELKVINKKVLYNDVLKSIKKRDKSDYNRKVAPLKKTKDSVLINTTNLSKRSCFLKIKKIIDRKLIINGNI
jgi:cytidylate kinase